MERLSVPTKAASRPIAAALPAHPHPPTPPSAGEGLLGEEEGGWGDERDMDPTPLRRPKQFDDLGGDAGGGNSWLRQLEGRRAGASAEAQAGRGLSQEEAEQARQQRLTEAAARKLEKLGAQVRAAMATPCTLAACARAPRSATSHGRLPCRASCSCFATARRLACLHRPDQKWRRPARPPATGLCARQARHRS